MKRILMIAAVVLLAVACNKNQSAVKKLDGEWNVTKMLITEDGKAAIDFISLGASVNYKFTKCKLSTDEYCDLSVTNTFDGSSDVYNGVFKVTDDGTTLVQADSDTSSVTTSIEIVELKSKTASFKQVDGTSTIEMDLEKL